MVNPQFGVGTWNTLHGNATVTVTTLPRVREMAEQIKAFPQLAPFDYELYEGDPDQLKTVDATPSQPNSYIDPAALKLKYRIGHGLFGDVWVATHHQSGRDYDEYHEVALKMIHPIKEDHVNEFLSKFEELWINLKSRQLQCVCWLHGISVISGKICIALKSYKRSIGDRMAHLKGGKLPLPDVLRYGIELAKGVQQLHQIGVLVLNLKPNNFLLDENDHVVLGDFGIPHLLLGICWHDSNLAFRLGSPNYMAPEQWEPGVRGPISYETDSWGFACSVIEMLTGNPPWFGRSVEEMHNAVVIRKEKPQVPTGLPPEVEDVLKGCFESRNAVYSDGSWSGLVSSSFVGKSHCIGYSTWFLSKDHLQVGDAVRSRKSLNTHKPLSLAVTEGVVVGLEKDGEKDGFAMKSRAFLVGQFVRLKANITTPHFEWPHKRGGAWASGKIAQILPNGCLEVKFPGRFVFGDELTCFLANPEEVECVSFDTCPGLVEKYELVEDFHWGVRPLAIAFGILTAMKFGTFVGRNVSARVNKRKMTQKQNDACNQEGQSSGNSGWLPPTVANILFKDGTSVSNSR
ncbi:hypothetical protein DH2020_016519 [Rehmannia glutinosa]|uniref:Protein kinase domain-containing protein n=1 Tax=Rehmannia glutinosa TaxID=99300 RepID=A0ABR0WRN3_REHGL